MISIYIPPSPGGEMKCPYCGENSAEAWKNLIVECPPLALARDPSLVVELDDVANKVLNAPDSHQVQLDWMHCQAEDCGQLIIRVHEMYWHQHQTNVAQTWEGDVWHARPHRGAGRHIEGTLSLGYRRDFEEAASILDFSPRMSAVLTRKIVFDLLEEYAGISEYTLKGSLDKFIADTSHPQRVRENLQHLREIGDFGAHTQKDGIGQIIDVDREDAEWTLDLVERLFEHFIFGPARDQRLRDKWEQNAADAGRRAIKPTPNDEVPSE